MSGFVNAVRRALGFSMPERAAITPEWERQSVERRLRDHEIRLNAMDARIDAQRAALQRYDQSAKE